MSNDQYQCAPRPDKINDKVHETAITRKSFDTSEEKTPKKPQKYYQKYCQIIKFSSCYTCKNLNYSY